MEETTGGREGSGSDEVRTVAWLPASLDACALFRMFLPHLHLPGSQFSFKQGPLDLSAIARNDVAVVQRLCTVENFKALEIIKKKLQMKVIYDLDDDMWGVPVYNPAHKVLKMLEPGFEVCASMADVVTVSTQHLKVIVQKELGKGQYRLPPVEVVENAIDFDWFAPLPDRLQRKKDGKVVVGWAGTNTHTGDVEKVFALLAELLQEMPELHLEFVGLPAPEQVKGHPRVKERDFIPVAEFAARWATWQWDISLAPLAENRFNRSKSSIKALEAAALHMPCVVSDVAPYRAFCEKDKELRKLVLCQSAGDWRRKLTALIKNEDLRKEAGERMYQVGRQWFDVEKRVERWTEVIEGL